MDGGVCKYCSLFAKNRSALGVLVNIPFRTCVNVTIVVDGHVSNKFNADAVEAALTFKQSIEQPQLNVDVHLYI